MASAEFIPFVPKCSNFKDVTGQRFGRLTALEPMRKASAPLRGAYWRCACDCGNTTMVNNTDLRSGNTNSCGCYQSDRARETQTKHLQCNTRTYHAWQHMKQRCDDPNYEFRQHYAGRGIAYDPRWRDFETFFADMGECPPSLTLDRRDNDGPYCKDNCRWTTRKEQNNNKRNTVHVEFRGQKMNLSDLSKLSGIPRQVIYYRLWNGWTVERAATEPIGTRPFANKKRSKIINLG